MSPTIAALPVVAATPKVNAQFFAKLSEGYQSQRAPTPQADNGHFDFIGGLAAATVYYDVGFTTGAGVGCLIGGIATIIEGGWGCLIGGGFLGGLTATTSAMVGFVIGGVGSPYGDADLGSGPNPTDNIKMIFGTR